MRLASFDIGSNSIKLQVVEATSCDSFVVLAREKETVRIGLGSLQSGHLSADTITRAAETIRAYRAIAESCKADEIIATATAAVREADNSEEFIRKIRELVDIRVDILSGVEEARLIGLAASHGCGGDAKSQLNIDIGGGSTEISVTENHATTNRLFSVKIGSVGLTDAFIKNDPIHTRELRALRAEIRYALKRPALELRNVKWELVTGTSGTIQALGVALAKRKNHWSLIERIEHASLSGDIILFEELKKFNAEMAAADLEERRNRPGISAQRAEIIIAGGQILEGVMNTLSINEVKTCDWALNEGIIIDHLSRMDQESHPPLPGIADPLMRGVRAVGLRFDYEEKHALHVAKLAAEMFDQLQSLHKLGRHSRTLLSASALLHDVGYHIAHDAHHKHSHYLIKHSELTGFSEAEKSVIANVARYHRRALPKDKHLDFVALSSTDQDLVWKLGSIVRLAEALDRGHDGRVNQVACSGVDGAVRLNLKMEGQSEFELWAVEQQREMFEIAYQKELKIECA